MTNFTYALNKPNPVNDPSVDVNDMQLNNNNNASIWDVDHIGFNTDDGGEHRQMTINAVTSPGAVSAAKGLIYTANGTASAKPEPIFKNSIATYPMLPIKAWGVFSTATGAAGTVIAVTTGSNVSSIIKGGTSVYDISLVASATTGTTIGCLYSISNTSSNQISWSIAGSVLSFTIGSIGNQNGHAVTFAVLQV